VGPGTAQPPNDFKAKLSNSADYILQHFDRAKEEKILEVITVAVQ